MNPFDFVNAISKSKENLIVDSTTEKEYNPFIVNKALSYFPDTVMYANEMNINNHLDNKLQFDYLLNSIRPLKRWSKWFKKEKNDDIQVIQQYYGFGYQKAKTALKILSKEQLDIIKKKQEKGGTVK